MIDFNVHKFYFKNIVHKIIELYLIVHHFVNQMRELNWVNHQNLEDGRIMIKDWTCQLNGNSR